MALCTRTRPPDRTVDSRSELFTRILCPGLFVVCVVAGAKPSQEFTAAAFELRPGSACFWPGGFAGGRARGGIVPVTVVVSDRDRRARSPALRMESPTGRTVPVAVPTVHDPNPQH